MIDEPIIVSCGDPAGIGPEVVQKAWNDLRDAVPMCMIGDPRFLPLDLPYVVIDDPAEAKDHCATALPILYTVPRRCGIGTSQSVERT